MIKTGDLRLSVLSERILRVEKSADGTFTDEPTQTIVNRSFAKPEFEASETEDKVTVTTKKAVFIVNKKTLKTGMRHGRKEGEALLRQQTSAVRRGLWTGRSESCA